MDQEKELTVAQQIFQSSTGQGLAKRWSAVFLGIIPVLSLLGPMLGLDFMNEAFLTAFGDFIAKAIEIVWTGIAVWMFIDGQIRAKKNKELGMGKYQK